MKINHRYVNMVRNTVNAYFPDRIQLYDISDDWKAPKFELGVNWSALGTVSAKDAAQFAKDLALASAVATAINSIDASIDYDSEPDREARMDHRDELYSILRHEVNPVEIEKFVRGLCFIQGGAE